MKTFNSDLSGKEFPLDDCVRAKHVRSVILDLIKKDHPGFTDKSCLSMSELNLYRQKYIAEYLVQEMGEVTELEKTVLHAFKSRKALVPKIEKATEPSTFGQRVADGVASFGGSWRFIISFGCFLLIWIVANSIFLLRATFDPYPFILLNLILSCIAALQAPVIMMSQNRQEEKDRERARKDYMINLKSELEIRMLHEKLDHLIMHQQQELIEIQKVQVEMMNDIMSKLNKV
jgi:uncharacterized membrane protein